MIKHTDFLVIGSGIAGLIYALDVCKRGKVTVLCKNNTLESNTLYAQGGIASVSACNDDYNSHVKDTLTAGSCLSDENVVQMVVENGPLAIARLVELGTRFDHSENYENNSSSSETKKFQYSLAREGGHSKRRILHSGDTTGAEIQRALINAAKSNKNIEILQYFLAIDLIKDHDDGGINGCYALNIKTGEVMTIGATTTLLASGGLGKAYLYTSNPDVATGDGVAMAFRAGAEIRNMEFIQFHPTCLFHPYAKNFLITEAMRGEGGKLVNRSGIEFMSRYHTLRDLAPRDIVARAIDKELKSTGEDSVFLDMRSLSADFIKTRFPSIYRHLLNFNIDATNDLIPVVPAAHYSCGGVRINIDGETTLPRLLAAGEVSCSGLHGANRLASNSLLEAVVFGRRAAERSISIFLKKNARTKYSISVWNSLETDKSDEKVIVSHSWDESRRTMWNLVGILRNINRLELARKRNEILRQEIESYYWKYQITSDLIELRNLLLVSSLIIESALKRKESRGLHYLEDYPSENPELSGKDTILKK
ncbi:MAG TPA: L-aspartate oxidase [Oligoflexia bacterium]|nr:L-aspartate oxidase [Oligoflexia bacterium]HMP48676.1 L-aspartate oxidase [Oligoflexia bacterium]